MNKTQRGSVLTIVLAIVVILIVLISIYAYAKSHDSYKAPENATSQQTTNATSTATSTLSTATSTIATTTIALKGDLSLAIYGKTLSLIRKGTILQTISLDKDAADMSDFMSTNVGNDFMNKEGNFITNLDVNFDGVNDVGVFTADGYGGVNLFYQFYLFNPLTERFEKSVTLDSIGNPTVDASTKTLRSSYKSGPQWYSADYVYNGSTYIKSKDFSAFSGENHGYTWLFTQAPDDGKLEAPRTQVLLKTKDSQIDAGTYYGTCDIIEDKDLQPGEVSGALCWWAGTGDEVGVFMENGKQVLKHGEQQEGTADEPGFRGNFKTLQSL